MSPSDANPSLLPPETILQHHIVPLAVEGEMLRVGVCEQPSPALLRDLAFLTGKTIVPIDLDASELEALLEAHLQSITSGASKDGLASQAHIQTLP